MAEVGVITLEIRLEHSHSLKEKRQVIKSLTERLRNRFNVAVAVAEIDYQDLWQRSVLSAVTVSNDRGHATQVLQAVEREAASQLGPALTAATVEWM